MRVIWKPTWRRLKWCWECWTVFLAHEEDIVEGRKNACFYGGDRGEPMPCVKCPRCGKLLTVWMSLERMWMLLREAKTRKGASPPLVEGEQEGVVTST